MTENKAETHDSFPAFQGRTAVVTGGTHGMGRAIAETLLAGGAEVLLTGRNSERVQQARDELDSPAAHVVRSDAAVRAEIDALGITAEQRLGHIDYLFVNHGIAEFQTLDEATEDHWDRIFDINAKGAFFTVQRLAPLLRDGGGIVFTTVSNDRIFPGLSAYSAAKEAVRAFARVLAAELLPRNIRVNAVAPGFILTPSMGVAQLTEQERAEFIREGESTTPMGRPGTMQEVADAAIYLAATATFTTGVELAVDGGFAQGIGG
ncbi:SDR family NAD(P)-dependent oxidoreductase [Nocardia sp. NPDC127526]|uniref:SDR family NAD(P)-dependent oxidoreductase n=1 Tax=Nocardia sp. NPDC127526 TaxID=3345393 RepID=UPI003634BDE0